MAGEVVLSASTVHSPTILMHSGVGLAEQLRRRGIEVIVDARLRRAPVRLRRSTLRLKACEGPTFSKLPYHPVFRSRSAMLLGARRDAASSTQRAAAHLSDKTALRHRRSPRW